jgi:hypothetical protein
MSRQLLYQYHLSLSFPTFCRPAKGNTTVTTMHYTITPLKRPRFTRAAPFTRKRTIQPLHHRKPGADEEEANLTGPNFPKDGGSIPTSQGYVSAVLALRNMEIDAIFSCLKKLSIYAHHEGFLLPGQGRHVSQLHAVF